MKRWIAVMAVCFAVLLGGGGGPSLCWGTTLITFTDNNPDGESVAALGNDGLNDVVWYASWTQTVPTTNNTIGAILGRHPLNTNIPAGGTVWLTNDVGPGANVIAQNTFTAPVITYSPTLNYMQMTTLFSGLDLGAGTYYLVLQGPLVDPPSPGQPPYLWYGDYTGVAVTTASSFSVGPYGVTSNPDALPPASTFTTHVGTDNFFYRVEGTVVPLPTSVVLFGSVLLGLAGWRRFRKS